MQRENARRQIEDVRLRCAVQIYMKGLMMFDLNE